MRNSEQPDGPMPETTDADVADDDRAEWGPLAALPGNPMMWLLIWSELAVFSLGLVGFAIAWILDPETFRQSQATLNRLAGAINTMVLVTSGFCAALAVNAQSRGQGRAARLWLAGACVLGLVFLAVKSVEYADKITHGIGLETNSFYTLYYLLTGFHALHVVMGIIILIIVGWRNSLENLETGAAFWHMVDLIWVLLFPVIYLMR